MAPSSQAATSSAAISPCSVSRRSSLSVSDTGGSTGTSAERSSRSRSSSGIDLRRLVQVLLELPDRTVDQHLGCAFGAPQRAGDLSVVHVERESHDQCLAT